MSKVARARLVAVAAVCLAVVAGGVSYASIPDANRTVHACYKTKSGQLRLIDTAVVAACKSNETALTWSNEQERSRYTSTPVGNTVPIFNSGDINVFLHCISNNSEIILTVGEDTWDVVGSRVTPTTSLPVSATLDPNNTLTYQATSQMLDLLIGIHLGAGSADTVQSLKVYSEQATAGHSNQCFGSAQLYPYFGP